MGVGLGALAISASLAPAAQAGGQAKVSISVLSGRADVVSGDDALIEVKVRSGGAGRVKVTVEPKQGSERKVTSAFRRRGHRLVGLVEGLDLGRNVVRATLPNGSGARLALINHPSGGPVFAGPAASAVEVPGDGRRRRIATSRRATTTSTSRPDGGQLQPYDPANPPSDVATTTTD